MCIRAKAKIVARFRCPHVDRLPPGCSGSVNPSPPNLTEPQFRSTPSDCAPGFTWTVWLALRFSATGNSLPNPTRIPNPVSPVFAINSSAPHSPNSTIQDLHAIDILPTRLSPYHPYHLRQAQPHERSLCYVCHSRTGKNHPPATSWRF